MTTKQRYDGVIAWFSEHMPVAESELHYTDPYQLLVAVILSAQCTDKRVNMTTPALFEAFPTPFDMAAATAEDIYPYIKSISYPNNKARNLAGMARMLCSEFGGEVPSDLQQMQRLPGVGRKTANVLGAVLWQKEVMPVDTHVFRVSNRIGLTTNSKTPLQTELTLEKNIPPHLLPVAHHWLSLLCRTVCSARATKRIAQSPCGAANTPPTIRPRRAEPPTENPKNFNDMTKNLFRILLFLLLPLAGQAKDADSLRVLWVGNSYTYYNDMPAIVQQIAATQKVKVSCTRFLKGGERFSGHLTNQKLLKALAAGGWDYVVLQEQSSAPAMPTRQGARGAPPPASCMRVHPTPV